MRSAFNIAAFNSLYGIHYIQVEDVVGKLASFQFPLWDSINFYPSFYNEHSFNSLYGIQLGANNLMLIPTNYFQFPLWDSTQSYM